MYIGNVKIDSRLALAPMAGVTDLAFRTLCREQGAGLTYTEMISAKALCYNDLKTGKLLATSDDEHPVAVQLFGSDPKCFEKAAPLAVFISKADILDLNMGCPTPKIVKSKDGCALMRDPRLASSIIETAVKSVKVPVTVKIRLGWDEESVNAVEFARMAEQSGASCVCVHARTCRQLYSGNADWDMIAKVKQAVHIPVIANGDVKAAKDVPKILNMTGADMAMIGRASLGNPWIFAQAAAVMEGRPAPDPPSPVLRVKTAVRQFEIMVQYKGERVAALEMRKHFAWYLRGLRNSSRFKEQGSRLACAQDVYDLGRRITEEYEN